MKFSELADWVRGRLLDFLPDWLDFIPADWPDWALFLAAPIVIFVVIGLALDRIFELFKKSKKGFQSTGRLIQGRSIEDPSPATEEGQAAIQRSVEQIRAEMGAKFDAIMAAVSPPAGAASLGVETEAAKKGAVVKLVTDAKYGEILGAHMVGPEVTELLPELTIAQMMELTASEISRNVHAHPSLSEVLMEAAHAAEGHSIHS